MEWHDLRGFAKSVETRYGTVSVVELGPDDERATVVEIRLDGELALPPLPRHGDHFIVSIIEVLEIADRDVVLLRGTAGGPMRPDVLLIAEIDARGSMQLVNDPAFRSSDRTERAASDGQRIYFDLGYQQRELKTALFERDRLEIFLTPAEPVPVPDSRCRFLHSVVGSSACILRQGLPNSVLRTLNALEQRPGFDREPFVQACELAGQGSATVPYEVFQRDVCELR